jgi:hypothetical protein
MLFFLLLFFKKIYCSFINAYTSLLQKEHTKYFLNKITNRKGSKQFITRKGSYILSYKFQREDSKNLTVFFYLDMLIGLIKYCFQLCKPSNFLFQNVSVCLYLAFESSNQASLFMISYC